MQNRQNLPPVNPQFPGFATFAADLRYSRSASKSPIWAWAAVRGGRYTNPISEKSIFPVQFAAGVFTGKIKQTLGGRREATAFCGSRPGRKHHAQITNRRCVAWQEAQDPSILGRRTPGGMGGVCRFHARRFERCLCGRYSLSKNLESSRGSKPFRASIVSGGSLKHFRVFRPLRLPVSTIWKTGKTALYTAEAGGFFHRKIPFSEQKPFPYSFCLCRAAARAKIGDGGRRRKTLRILRLRQRPKGYGGGSLPPRLGIIRARTAARIAGSSPRSERPRLLRDSRYKKICRRLGSGQYGAIFQTHIP